jgi:hypothetical protein
MSSLSEQNPSNPQDPLHYAPRHMRERPESARLSLVEDTRDRPAQAERNERAVATTNNLDSRLENAVFESLRHSLDPHVMREPPAYMREQDRRSIAFKIAGRFAAAIGVAAVVALFFVNIVPVTRQPDASSSFVAAIQSMKTTAPPPAAMTAAVPDDKDIKAEQPETTSSTTDIKAMPALSQFKSLLATDDAAQAPKAEKTEKAEASDGPLLQQFMQWNQKSNPSDKAQ